MKKKIKVQTVVGCGGVGIDSSRVIKILLRFPLLIVKVSLNVIIVSLNIQAKSFNSF